LRWGVQNGYTVMLSQTTEHSAAETLDVVAWRLSRKAMDLLNALNQGLRFFKPAWCPFDESAFPKDIQLPK
jgi:diketogulonate reductase-like aldo/keto reductase